METTKLKDIQLSTEIMTAEQISAVMYGMINPTFDTGIKIATINVDGQTKDVFAPNLEQTQFIVYPT